MISKLVDAWQGYTRRRPVVVTLILALLFTLAVLLMHAVIATCFTTTTRPCRAPLAGRL